MTIYCNLIGGLGNQMFQYACGVACAADSRQPLKICIDQFHNYTLHNGAELSRVFDTSLDICRDGELSTLLGWQAPGSVRRLLGKPAFRWLAKRSFVAEPSLRFWPQIAQRTQSSCYMHGYWQSESYFKHHEDLIRRQFRFRNALSTKNARIAERIASESSVSLHVRRGDYLSNPKNLRSHGLCSIDYYLEALKVVFDRLPDAPVYAFSDDPEWVKTAFSRHIRRLEVIGHNKGSSSYVDMQLMSLCDHHVIANSSFSWWGAWLNPSRSKIVVAPQRWFADGRDSSDLIPSDWIRI